MEVLLTEMTSAVIAGEQEKISYIKKIIKEYFSPKTELGKEYRAYKVIQSISGYPKDLSEKMLKEAKQYFKTLNKKEIFNSQTKLIVEMNKNFGENIWLTYIPNYKELATYYQVFNGDLEFKHKVLLEQYVINKMTKKELIKEEVSEIDPEQLNSLVIRKFTENFNKEYSNLLEEQKILLNKYIFSKFDEAGFVSYINEEIDRLKKEILHEKALKTLGEEKSLQVKQFLEGFSKIQTINEEHLEAILSTQELIKEIKEDNNEAN